MNAKILSLLLSLLLALSLCACAGRAKNAPTGTPKDSGAQIPSASAAPESLPTDAPQPTEPVLSALDPYVLRPDIRGYLTQDEEQAFRTLIDAIFAREERVTLLADYDANLRVLGAARYNPYWFFVEDSHFSDDHTAVILTYAYSAEEQASMRQFMDSEYLRILNSILTPEMNELDQVLSVYHYFASRIEYNYDWLEALNMADDKYLFPDIAIYEALQTGRGVCHTYTYLCEFALQQLHIACLPMTGVMNNDPESGHMWLAVQLDGSFYHMDPTWDAAPGMAGLNYFGMTDEERAQDITIDIACYDESYGPVVCTDSRFFELRGVSDYAYLGSHEWALWYEGVDEPVSFRTQ